VTPLLVETVTAATTAELRQRRDAVTDADLVELRLDSVRDPSVPGALAGRRRPVIVTCRPTWEGGAFGGSEAERLRLLTEAFTLGAEYVDIEWQARFGDLVGRAGGRRIVLSSHDFTGVPSDLASRVQAMRATGAEVVKIAVTARRLSDCIPLHEAGAQTGRQGGLVLIGMGEPGLPTRIVPRRFGSIWTYGGSQREVGQVSIAALVEDYRIRHATTNTDIYGVVGRPVGHSVSPAMHNAAFGAARLDAIYLPFAAADADDFLAFAGALGVKGASVTVPFKVAFFDRMQEVYSVARRIGAINTIRLVDGRWVGDNTDASGFLHPLLARMPLSGVRAAVVGAGGAARAVSVALASSGADVRVHARRCRQAEEVAVLVGAEVGAWPVPAGSWDLLVNCTPVGMTPGVDETPIDAERLTGRLVYDLIYNPPITRLMRDASRAGCQTIGGLEMLVAQAHEQFSWWTGGRAKAGVMREAALKRLAEFMRDENHVV
jgi:3-dehydroquinate dehydratase / shikimate dehydrogenase